MSDFLNPLGGRFIGPSGPVATSSVLGTVPDPPRGFRELDPGTIIKGVVLGRESDGLTAIATDKGTVRVASTVPLQTGAQVTLEVRPTGDRLQVLILASDAAPRSNTPAQASSAGAQAAQTATGQPSAAASPQSTPQPAPATAAAATGPDTRGPDTRAPDPRSTAPTTATASPPARSDPPSIEFVGSSIKAVVVQALPAAAAPLPSGTPAPAPPAQQAPAQQTPAQPVSVQQPPAPAQSAPASPNQQPRPPQLQPAVPLPAASQTPAPPAPNPPTPTPNQAQPAPILTTPAQTPPPAQLPLPPAQTQAPLPAPPSVPQTPPQNPPQNPGQASTPPAPLPQTPAPPVPAPPATVNVVPPTSGAPIPTESIPTGPLPTTSPSSGIVPPTPVTTPPVTSTPPTTATTTPPALPQGAPIPAASGTPLPTSAATLQAALLSATSGKKDAAGQPITTLYAPTTVAPAVAAQEYAEHDAVPTLPGQVSSPDEAAATSLSSRIPINTAFNADTRLRILALFANAGVTSGETQIAAGAAAETHATTAQPLPLGAELKLRVLAVQMQAHQPVEFDPISADPHDEHAQVIFGRVVSITPAGHAVIHTPLGDIMLQNKSSLAVGARLALAIDTMEAAPPAAAIMAPVVQTPQQALLTLSQSWPTLADFIAIFQGAAAANLRSDNLDPDIARQALAMLPHAGVKLGAGMMNAMAALRSGDIGKLLGPLFAAKGAGGEREEMVRRLRGEFSQLSALAQDRPEVDWRAMFLPVIDDQGRVTQINLFYRRPKKGEADDNAGGNTGTRFVVEADFTRLGPFQLDGLMRKQRFDLMIRSRSRLDDRMRRDIEAIYEETRGLTGFAGTIAFQTVDEFPVIPLDDLKRGQPTVVI